MRLVDDWKSFWRWFTTWISALGIVALEVYQQMQVFMPDLVKAIPDNVMHRLLQVLLFCIIVGRVIKQGGSNVPPNPPAA